MWKITGTITNANTLWFLRFKTMQVKDVLCYRNGQGGVYIEWVIAQNRENKQKGIFVDRQRQTVATAATRTALLNWFQLLVNEQRMRQI